MVEVLSKRLKWLREKKRYPQKEIAEKIGMTVSGYQKFEYDNRDPKLDVLIELSKIFNVTTDFLLGLTDETEKLREIAFRAKSMLMEKKKIETIDEDTRQRLSFLREQTNELRMIEKKEIEKLAQSEELEKYEISEYNQKLAKIRNQIEMIDQRNKDYERKLSDVNTSIYNLHREYSYEVLNYIQFMLDIPSSKAKNSPFLKQHMPIITAIQENLFETYSIYISGINLNANYGEFETEEEAEKERLRLEKFLNE